MDQTAAIAGIEETPPAIMKAMAGPVLMPGH
jgi:hypothetical protein